MAEEPKEVFENSVTRHGTPSGFRLHQDRGEWPCDACYRAKQEYDKRWRSAPERTKKNRLHARAQNRTLVQLKNRHPEEYRELYQANLAAVRKEAAQMDEES